MERRRFLVGTAALGLSMAQTGLAFGAGRDGNIAVHLDNARSLAKLSGNDLRIGLLKNLSLASRSRVLVPAQLFVLRLEDGRIADSFQSGKFEVAPGRMAFPGEMNFPGEMTFPGEMNFPGEMSFPGEMTLPGRNPMEVAMQAAMSTLLKRDAANGFFFVVFALEHEITGQGLGLATVRA